MKKGSLVKIILFLLIAVAVGGSFTVVLQANNAFVKHEEDILAQYKKNEAAYKTMLVDFQEVSTLGDIYKTELKDIFKAAIKSSPSEGSKEAFRFIVARNPEIEPETFAKIKSNIDTSRLSMETNKKALDDKKALYRANLKEFPNSLAASILGFPKLKSDKFDPNQEAK